MTSKEKVRQKKGNNSVRQKEKNNETVISEEQLFARNRRKMA